MSAPPSADTGSSPTASLWRHHDFRLLWAGDAVSVFGMQFVAFAIPFTAVQLLNADPFEMGLLAALQSAAFLLISLPAGAWVDRSRKKLVIIVGDLLRAALLLTIPAAWLADALTMLQLYVVAASVGVITVFFDVANQSYLPQIVDGNQIGDGNGKLQASQQTAMAVGPAVAASLVRWIGSPLTIAVTSVLMALSSIFVSRIRHREQPADPQGRQLLAAEIREGMAFVLKHPLLRRIVTCTGFGNLASSAVLALFPLYVLRTLGLSEITLGIVMSVGAAGGIVGAFTASRFQRFVGEGRAIPVAALLIGVATLGTPLASTLPTVSLLVVGGFLTSWSAVVYNITQVSFRQRLCPKPLLGRMNASVRFLVWGPMPVGAFLGGLIGRHIGVLPTIWIFTVIALLAALPVLLSSLITMRDLPRELDALADEPK